MKMLRPLIITSFLLVCTIISACLSRSPLPAAQGMSIEVRPADIALPRTDPKRNQTLQVYWFGSGCHLLELGDQVLLTDPFFVNKGLFANKEQRSTQVQSILQNLPRPQAILVNHSHIDHFLDAKEALSTPGWEQVPLYGGLTCKHLIAGWKDNKLTKQVFPLPAEGGNRKVRHGFRFSSFRSTHSPHLSCGLTFLDHSLSQPRSSPPQLATHYPAGETYNFLIQIHSTEGKRKPQFNIFYLAAPADLNKLPNSVPDNLPPIDLLIVPAPGQDNVRGFPEEHLCRLRPRHILINHFNHFLKENPDRRLELLGKDLANPEKLSRKIQDSINRNGSVKKRFEAIHIPSLTEVTPENPAQNVILIHPPSKSGH